MQYVTLSPTVTANLTLQGYQFNRLDFVLLSSANTSIFPYLCSYKLFTPPHRGSTRFTTVSGHPWPHYTVINKNTVKLSLTAGYTPGVYDIVFGNQAGYTKLSDKDHLILVLSV
mgnify:CR=1 FL=1|jgi:hypothetical protein